MPTSRLAALLAASLTAAFALGLMAPQPARALVARSAPEDGPGATFVFDVLDATVAPIERSLGPGRVEAHVFWSGSLGRTMPYRVYLPPGYDAASARQYPSLYLLHGLGGTETQWIDMGIARAADRLIRSGEIAPLVIVMPAGENGYWMDHANAGPKWGSYTAIDLPRDVEATYRVMRSSARRAVGGLSMGAHGALQLALNYPNTFAAVGSHSLVLRRHDVAPAYFGDRAEHAKRDPMQLVHRKAQVARSLALWIDIGDQDPWAARARDFVTQLAGLGIAHQWRLWPGGHSDAYWSAHLADYLRFYDAALDPTHQTALDPRFAFD